MIDWHSHVLPQMDDGSCDVTESIELINMQASQGINVVVATPHFYANDETVKLFLERRMTSFEILKSKLTNDMPKLLLGAEVKYYQGISRMADIDMLKIEGSKLILLEMPTTTWTEYMVRELIEMSSRSSIKIVLAHVERYLNFQNKKIWRRILESGILAQTNAEFYISFNSKRKAVSLLKERNIHFVGSDCHGLKFRPPQIGKAFEVIRKKLGNDYVNQMNEYGYSLLDLNNK